MTHSISRPLPLPVSCKVCGRSTTHYTKKCLRCRPTPGFPKSRKD